MGKGTGLKTWQLRERTRPQFKGSVVSGSFFGCVGMFGAEILGDAGQTKWLTWNYDATSVNYCVHVNQSNITQIFRNVKWAG